MSRLFAVGCALTFTLAACSGGERQTVASTPTAPTDLATVTPGAAGVSGPTAMPSPARNETVDFRNQLETKYQTGLNRTATITAVDREGEVIWIQEYIRYRVSGCDHGTSVQRVMTQIDSGAAGPDCGATPTGAVAVSFPSRADVVTLRQQLETRYQQMNRGLVSTFVDAEGAAIWTSEYLRYRTNDCDHAAAVQKVLTQVDGNAAPATCVTVFAACSYRFSQGGQDVPSAGGDFFVDIHKLAGTGACTWTVTNLASSFVSQVTPTTGDGFGKVTFRVARNDSASRTGNLRFSYEGGSITHEVALAGSPYTVLFNMVDSNRSGSATTECQIRGTATPCTFTALVHDTTLVAVAMPVEQNVVWEGGRIVTYSRLHVERLVAQLQAATNTVLGRAGARLLIGTVMVV